MLAASRAHRLPGVDACTLLRTFRVPSVLDMSSGAAATSLCMKARPQPVVRATLRMKNLRLQLFRWRHH